MTGYRALFSQLRQCGRVLNITRHHSTYKRYKRNLVSTVGTAVGIGSAIALWRAYEVPTLNADVDSTRETLTFPSGKRNAGQVIPGIPEYTLSEVSQHTSPEKGVWVTYGDGVYDVTEFIDQHPGGKKVILLAAGGALEKYWEVFSAHNNDDVRDILEQWRIGNVSVGDRGKAIVASVNLPKQSLYTNEPLRSPLLVVSANEPFTAESPLPLLVKNFITPNELFYVRNHFAVPLVDPATYLLEVSVEGVNTLRLTLHDLKTKFKQYTVTATLQCAGNRGNEYEQVKPMKVLGCTAGAIGNAEWTGIRLRDVLLYAGLKDQEEYALKHVHLEGLDSNPVTKENYAMSIPIEKAMDIRGDCLLAYKMNGKELPRDHGFPLRAIIPGTVGARNVKWLGRITASENEHEGFWHQVYYKGFSPSVDWGDADASKAQAIQEMPVQSVICSPGEGDNVQIEDGEITVNGFAWSGGGRGITRVDVSGDGGKTWYTADMVSGPNQRWGRVWAWSIWEVSIPVPSDKNKVELVCKAVDTTYNVQPDSVAGIWNMRGSLLNAWHRVKVSVSESGTRA